VRDETKRPENALISSSSQVKLPQVYLGRTTVGSPLPRPSNIIWRLKWIISTCIVGIAGVCVIAVVMYASMDVEDGSGMISSITRASLSAMQPQQTGRVVADRPDIAFGQKTDRIELSAKGITTTHVIHDNVVLSRAGSEFIEIKPYTLIKASLSTETPPDADSIPNLNPFDLYATRTPLAGARAEATQQSASSDNVAVSYLELAGNRLPVLDTFSIPIQQAEQYVAEAAAVFAESGYDLDGVPSTDISAADAESAPDDDEVNVTVIAKADGEDDPSLALETRSVIVRSGDTLFGLLRDGGALDWQAKAIVSAMDAVPGSAELQVGQELRFTNAPPTPGKETKGEPVRISLFSGLTHIVSVTRTEAGDYAATDDPVQIAAIAQSRRRAVPTRATLYASIYHTARMQALPADFIMDFLRIHAYDVDFKRKTQLGDEIEMFFDVERGEDGSDRPGELLFAAVTVNGETYRYYRFRTPEGTVDFYNEEGSNSRKFLMREPVKGGRFTSGFGYRRHPILGTRRMHTGVDWAAPPGTPILAAGSGTVEFAGRRGGYGNRVRIRHGNGYQTTYSHLQRIADGITQGAQVAQGEVIGYVGSTGVSTGPHLHYEVLVDNRFTDPMKIQVPRSRQLQGRLLAEFRRERARIDDLMNRAPVRTQVAAVSQ
jgi:murein DD-endopeptidase MepM/ murein hydrolase activator NlpD